MARTSRYKTTQLNLAGSSSYNRSEPASIQRTLNLYPEIPGDGGIDSAILHGWPNLEIEDVSQVSTEGLNRGMHRFGGDLYQVFGNSLIRYVAIDVNNASIFDRYTVTVVGTIAGVGRVGMEKNGVVMIITN